MKISIKRVNLTKSNIAVLEALDRECFNADYPYKFKKSQAEYWWIAYLDSKPIAFAGFTVKDKQATFVRAGILELYRKKGIHKRLIRARLRYIKRLGLENVITYTSIDNNSSFNNLIRLGFDMFKWKVEKGGKDRNSMTFLWFKLNLV